MAVNWKKVFIVGGVATLGAWIGFTFIVPFLVGFGFLSGFLSWMIPFVNQTVGTYIGSGLGAVGAILLGSEGLKLFTL